MTLETLSGWGRAPVVVGHERRGEDLAAITDDVPLTRGLGRSYGDASLPPAVRPLAAGSALADRVLAFDPQTGLLRAEAGFSLDSIYRHFLPRGWFVPTTPGTRFVTLGGMIAADVHGKNHHRTGCFGAHVRKLRLRVADGRILDLSPELEPELFWATIGGMGLTGHILEAEVALIQVSSPWIWQESERVADVDRFQAALAEAGPNWPFTVGWIDCLSKGANLGRGVLYKGRWAEPAEAPARPPRSQPILSMPFDLPGFVLSEPAIRAFNEVYFRAHPARPVRRFVSPEPFFYPLDAIRHWNRMYGRRGFTQYQCVLPKESGPDSARRFLELLTSLGGASFLCVIKDCGPEGRGLLSFPKAGISIALDIAVTNDTPALVAKLNRRTIDLGGRVYLAKDAFTTAEDFRAMEPRLPRFLEIKRHWDSEGKLGSALAERVLGMCRQ